MTPAQEAAARRGQYIPATKADLAALAREQRAERRAGRAQPATAAPAPSSGRYETKQVKVDRYGFLGTKTGGQKKLADLVADGWEIVDSPAGGWYGRGLYTLRRPL